MPKNKEFLYKIRYFFFMFRVFSTISPEKKNSMHNTIITFLEEPDSSFSVDDYKVLEKYYTENFAIFGQFKMAQVIPTPVIAFAKLFEEYNPQFKTQGFSTIEAALEWMEL